MRIGMILDKSFPPDPRVENEARILIRKGHEVVLFCLNYNNQQAREVYQGIRVQRYTAGQWIYKASALSYTLPFYRWALKPKIREFLKTFEVGAIHVHDMVVARAVYEVKRKLKLPLVLDLHENRPEIMKTYPHLQKFPGNWLIDPEKWKRMEERLSRRYDHIIVVTQEAKEDLLSRTGEAPGKIVVLPNTVREAFYKEAHVDSATVERYKGKDVILYLGDTGLRRGLLTVVEALPELVQRLASLKLVVVGSSSTDGILKKRVEELGLESVVDFEGWQDESRFPAYIEASEVCISPLHRNKHHDTTYANKIFQYMSLGKPVLASDALAQKRLIERTGAGLIHREQDPADFAEKCHRLLTDEALRLKLGRNGRRFIEEEFSWSKVSMGLTNLYKELDMNENRVN